jgi:hypothetical protein
MQGKLADMYTTMNAYVYAVARPVTRNHAQGYAFSITWCALEAIQALGGNGYINDYPTGRLLRDAKLYEIGAGKDPPHADRARNDSGNREHPSISTGSQASDNAQGDAGEIAERRWPKAALMAGRTGGLARAACVARQDPAARTGGALAGSGSPFLEVGMLAAHDMYDGAAHRRPA